MIRIAPQRFLGIIGGVALLGCASDFAADRSLRNVEFAPAEIAILEVEDRTSSERGLPNEVRTALVAQAVDSGFSPLSRTFVDAASINPDTPALGQAGVLRFRILSWTNIEFDEPVLSVRYHMTLHGEGVILADILQSERLVVPPAQQNLAPRRRMGFLLEILAERAFQKLPPPPSF